jgi:hypothetical protein
LAAFLGAGPSSFGLERLVLEGFLVHPGPEIPTTTQGIRDPFREASPVRPERHPLEGQGAVGVGVEAHGQGVELVQVESEVPGPGRTHGEPIPLMAWTTSTGVTPSIDPPLMVKRKATSPTMDRNALALSMLSEKQFGQICAARP